MPELPDLAVYVEALAGRTTGRALRGIRLLSPFVLRSVEPTLTAAAGREVVGVRRLGKRLVLGLEGDLFLVLHLMISGRLRWLGAGARGPGRITLALLDFDGGTLAFTEASKKKRAWLRCVAGERSLAELDPGGVEPLTASDAELRAALGRENRTLKRALTDARLIAGIGNAYSDEILWAARLSPFARTSQLDEESWTRLVASLRATLRDWIERTRAEAGGGFPDKVTAFRPGMAVHGRFREACPRCGGAVQRIVYAENEANYCPGCQTGGRLLADRALSQLARGDWPRTLEELEERKAPLRPAGGEG